MRDAGNLLQVQFERFVDEKFVESAVFAEYEGVIEAGDQKNILNLKGHQVVEAFEASFGVKERFGYGAGGHWSLVGNDTRVGTAAPAVRSSEARQPTESGMGQYADQGPQRFCPLAWHGFLSTPM